jgi:hypothetical protein
MPPTTCPFESASALLVHSETCPVCAARKSDVLSLAIQIVLAETAGSVVYEKGIPRLLIVDPNHDATTQDRPVSTFREFAQTRYVPGSLVHLRPGAQKIYDFVLRRYVLPELGSFPLSEITYEMIQNLVAKMLTAGYSVQTAKHAKMVTNRVFVHAERVGAFRGRPTSGVPMRRAVSTMRRYAGRDKPVVVPGNS